MRGDFSRLRFERNQNYVSVLQQQGRVALDADANEQCFINDHLRSTETRDLVGRSGGPKSNEGFKITTANGGIQIGAGRYYVDGILCENSEPLCYSKQPYLVDPTSSDATLLANLQPGGNNTINVIQVYLEVWQRLVTGLDDPCLLEPALGQADTTARLQTVWRVVAEAPTNSGNASGALDCNCNGCPDMTDLSGPKSTGQMMVPPMGSSDDCSCQPTPQAGYRGLENQLYRVEIHEGGDETNATFKWSRDNGSVVVAVTGISGNSGNQVQVDSLGFDANLGFSANQWVELTDDSYEFGQPPNKPGVLCQIESTTPGQLYVTMNQSVTGAVDPTKNARMRRWDQSGSSAGSNGVPLSVGSPVSLENGIQVQFTQGQYQAGDYWLIPARTATGQVEWPPCGSNGNLCQPPHSIEIHRAPLAYIQWDTQSSKPVPRDCRVSFNPLTSVDLCFHNKHLHGWGIVCGLQLNCGCDRTHVTVRKGYALDCGGCDVRLGCDAPVSLVAMAQDQSLLDSKGDGDVSLILENDGSFTVEQEDSSKESLASYFQNTIWVDFWQKCVEPLVNFFTSQFTAGPGQGMLVGPGQQRIDTFTNLVYQLAHTNGQYVFVSPEENTILSNFYTGLKQLLASRTFCGLFDNARPFPQYPFASLNIHSIFGSGGHARVRVHPDGTRAYTVAGPFSSGGDNVIHVYDLQKMVMAAEVPFPNQTAAVVQDVAFSPDGTQLYAIALLGSNSVFAVATIQGFNLNWIASSTNTLAGAQLATLAVTTGTSPNNVTSVWAVTQGQAGGAGVLGGGGLYLINPGGTLPTGPILPFNAFGHLVIGSQGFAYMTANSGAASGAYNCVYAVDYMDPSEYTSIQLTDSNGNARQGTSGDDIAVAIDPQGRFSKLYVVVDPLPGGNTQLLDYSAPNVVTGLGNGVPLTNTVDLGQATPTNLAFNPANSYLLLGYADDNWLGVLDPTTDTLSSYQSQELQCAVPTELSPQSMALGPWLQNPSNQTVYVLNVANSTISAIPATMLVPSTSGDVTLSEFSRYINVKETAATLGEPVEVSLSELATYRNGVLNAFADLLGVFLEDLKDCFCDRLLVNCPSCDEDDKLYLGCIQIRNSEVYRICNLSRRRYVKTFPTFGYWLSAVPILPVLKWAVAKFCCAVLPDTFSKFQAGATTTNRITNTQIINLRSNIQQVKLGNFVSTLFSKGSTAGNLATDSISAAVFNPKAAAGTQIDQGEVVGQQTSVVNQRLTAAKIVVDSVQPYDPAAGATNVTAFLGSPTSLLAGSHVILYEQNGVVRYYTLSPQPTPAVQNLTAQVQAQQTTLSSLLQSQQLVADQQKTIAAHEQEIASLKTSLSQMQQDQTGHDQQLTALKSQIQGLMNTPPKK